MSFYERKKCFLKIGQQVWKYPELYSMLCIFKAKGIFLKNYTEKKLDLKVWGRGFCLENQFFGIIFFQCAFPEIFFPSVWNQHKCFDGRTDLFWEENKFALKRDFQYIFDTKNTKSPIQRLKIKKNVFSILVLGSYSLAKNARTIRSYKNNCTTMDL
jgi:hypothetical protein